MKSSFFTAKVGELWQNVGELWQNMDYGEFVLVISLTTNEICLLTRRGVVTHTPAFFYWLYKKM